MNFDTERQQLSGLCIYAFDKAQATLYKALKTRPSTGFTEAFIKAIRKISPPETAKPLDEIIYHEVGHALLYALLNIGKPKEIYFISFVPHHGASGEFHHAEMDYRNMTAEQLKNVSVLLLGGMAAQLISHKFGNTSSESDVEETKLIGRHLFEHQFKKKNAPCESVTMKTQDMMQDSLDTAENILRQNWPLVEMLVQYCRNNAIVSGQDITQIITTYRKLTAASTKPEAAL